MKVLIELVSDKIEQLERFREVTSRMICEDFDNIEQLMDERDGIIRAADAISADIKQYVNSQPAEIQKTLTETFRLKNRKEHPELYKVIDRMERLKLELKELDEQALSRLKKLQKDLLNEMSETKKTKQVTDYFSQTGIDLSKGSNLNVKN